MYFLTRVTFGACLVPCITAFYPYVESGLAETATPSEPSSLEQRGVEQDSVLRMSIKRTPVKRDNRYNIIGAALPARTSSLGVDQDGTDFSYFSTFTFGTSKKSYHMLLDSGAGSTWVYGTGCTSDACKAHNALGTAESTSLNVSNWRTLCLSPHVGYHACELVLVLTGTLLGFLNSIRYHLRYWKCERRPGDGHLTVLVVQRSSHLWTDVQCFLGIHQLSYGWHTRSRTC